MRPSALRVLVFVLLAAVAAAQQPNIPGLANMTINMQSGPPYPIRGLTVFTGVAFMVDIGGGPNLPFITYQSSSLLARSFPVLGNQLVDINPVGAVAILDGLRNPLANTGATGVLSFPVTLAQNTPTNLRAAFQTLMADPSFPAGARLTAATEIVTRRGISTQTPAMGDDVSATLNLSPQNLLFNFYGTNYTSLFINSNGHLTFGSGDTNFTPTPAQFLSGAPRISMFWTDLIPNTGQVTATFDESGVVTTLAVRFNNVPSFGNLAFHTFEARLQGDPFNQIDIAFSVFNPGAGFEQITGIGPGGNRSTSTTETNLSSLVTTPVSGAANQSIFEFFGLTNFPNWPAGRPSNPFDLTGRTLTFFPITSNSYFASAL